MPVSLWHFVTAALANEYTPAIAMKVFSLLDEGLKPREVKFTSQDPSARGGQAETEPSVHPLSDHCGASQEQSSRRKGGGVGNELPFVTHQALVEVPGSSGLIMNSSLSKEQ